MQSTGPGQMIVGAILIRALYHSRGPFGGGRGGTECDEWITVLIHLRHARRSDTPQHEVAVLLQQCVFTAIAPVGVRICQMLPSIEFDHKPGVGAEQIYFHLSPAVKRDRQLGIQLEAARRFR
jgi:hypothetical protein